MIVVQGIDAHPRGWVAVDLCDGRVTRVRSAPRLDALTSPDCAAIGVDIPLGFPERGWRAADRAARAVVGARRNSVFLAPPRSVWEQDEWETANALTRQLTDSGLSKQAYALRAKVLEADVLRQSSALPLYEVHPEVSFATMNGAPLDAPKKSWNGQAVRRRLLAERGLLLAENLGRAGSVAVDDILDAAAAAWSAHRIATGAAESLPEPPDRDCDGQPMAIWY